VAWRVRIAPYDGISILARKGYFQRLVSSFVAAIFSFICHYFWRQQFTLHAKVIVVAFIVAFKVVDRIITLVCRIAKQGTLQFLRPHFANIFHISLSSLAQR
jgi:hypothetical protein